MPKSRFNAARERARATRHNPLQRAARQGATSEGGLQAVISGGTGDVQEAVIPILNHLPLPSSSKPSASTDGDIFWALTSLTTLLSHKPSRAKLLAPQHDVVARVLHVLSSPASHDKIEIQMAASGCLRNICVEAGHKARKTLENKGATQIILEQINAIAGTLGLVEGAKREEAKSVKPTVEAQAPEKPFEEMNKKEKRHYNKAKARMAEEGGNDAAAAAEAMEPDDDDEAAAIACNHLSNLVTVLWCLVEVSPRSLEACDAAAPSLASIFCGAVAQSVEALQSLSNASANGATNHNGQASKSVGEKDREKRNEAVVEAGLACLNALLALSDSDASFSAALAGISQQELRAATREQASSAKRRARAKGVVIADGDNGTDATQQAGMKNLGALSSAVILLKVALDSTAALSTAQAESLKRQAVSLGLVSLATLRNVQSSLPRSLREVIKFGLPASAGGATIVIKVFEEQYGLPCLLQVLQSARAREVKALLDGYTFRETAGDEAEAEQTSKSRRASEELHNIELALEVLAEVVGDLEAWKKSRSQEQDDDDDDDDDDNDDGEKESMELDEEMMFDDETGADSGSATGDDREDGMMATDEGEEEQQQQQQSQTSFAKTPIACFLTLEVVELLLALSSPSDQISDSYPGQESNALASGLRSISTRAISVLHNAFLVLATAAPPPPSQPITSASGQAKKDNFLAWLSGASVQTIWHEAWIWSFELAARVASTPAVAASEGDLEEASQGRATVEACLGILWSLSRCFEDAPLHDALCLAPSEFPDKTSAARNGMGVVASMIAAYRSTKGATTPAKDVVSEPEGDAASMTTSSSSSDGLRVSALGTLSALLRRPTLDAETHRSVTSFLVDVVDAVPVQGSGSGSGGDAKAISLGFASQTSPDGLVVALNGLIDTFADETKPWDASYKVCKVGPRLKGTMTRVKAVVKSIDKRKTPRLRAMMEETAENALAFVQYRDGLA
ncbi:hypothetical protein FA10DRAFT_76285 [Acaromyces ingoldii]|uniref:SYO1-like TPR repeats domain-containing protein n=1 Tax=Acaromyces ingoldii TaxID=215250 RepID=A0A316YT27_9BASI|nr:hypothetical protein FA10DRAFT_76285 [Acaromyces ingoldii]PWN91828.1 hypothetical protein FA10DRAFT_76285 [Acaromyces ingoldii]